MSASEDNELTGLGCVEQQGRQQWNIEVLGSDRAFSCPAVQSVLDAMIGARRTSIRAGCKNGGCGICRIKVKSGSYVCGKMSRSRIAESDEAAGIVLACRVYPRSDLAIEPLPLVVKAAVG